MTKSAQNPLKTRKVLRLLDGPISRKATRKMLVQITWLSSFGTSTRLRWHLPQVRALSHHRLGRCSDRLAVSAVRECAPAAKPAETPLNRNKKTHGKQRIYSVGAFFSSLGFINIKERR